MLLSEQISEILCLLEKIHTHFISQNQKIKGEDYIKKYFQWSILENFDERTDDSIILEREKYWKLVLNSKNQGLNDNY